MTLLYPLLQSHWDYGIFSKNVQVGSHCLIDTLGSDPEVLLTPRDPNLQSHWDRGIQTLQNDYLNFLGEYEAICETALAHESGP
jgi:hypothetical protein